MQTLSEGSRICSQRQIRLGGGVAHKTIHLCGQGLIEYVLIIAVIGLVVIFAGPGVAGAIRNQFNLVGNTVNSGINGGVGGGGASGGDAAGTDSATVQAAVAKDAKDWTVDEQKAVAEDISAKGEASPAYAKAKAAMDARTLWSVKLTDGRSIVYQIIGINHDVLADGTGKAGLTFLATMTGINSRMNATNTNAGGWEASELRAKMNSGKIWNLMPSDFQSKFVSVIKTTDNVKTNDKLFLPSATEMGIDSGSDGYRYESRVYPMWDSTSNVLKTKTSGVRAKRRMPQQFILNWLRTPANTEGFLAYSDDGNLTATSVLNSCAVLPAWCF